MDDMQPEELDPNRFGRVSAVVEACAAMLLVTLCLMLLASSVMRHLGMGDPRLFELTRVAFVYLVGVAAVAAFLRVENIVVPGVWRMGTPGYQIAQAAVGAVLTWLAARYIYSSGFEIDTMSLLRLPEATPYVPVLVFAVAVTLISAARAAGAIGARPAGAGGGS